MARMRGCYKYFVPTGLSGLQYIRVEFMSEESKLSTPLVSAICWKCYKSKTCDAEVCDLHKLFHRICESLKRKALTNSR
jgi:hypothetical protein